MCAGMGGFPKVSELVNQFKQKHRIPLFHRAYSRWETDLDCMWILAVRRCSTEYSIRVFDLHSQHFRNEVEELLEPRCWR